VRQLLRLLVRSCHLSQVYGFSSGTAQQHERRALMACLLLPPVQTFTLVMAAAVLLKLRRGLGCAAVF